MTVQTFGVTYSTVKAHFFPQHQGFSANTTPSSTTVTEEILWVASDLDAKLRAKAVDPASIVASSAAYYWCAQTIALKVAAKISRSVSGADPAIAKAWQTDHEARLKQLKNEGVSTLGDGAVATGGANPGGPTDHISTLGLDIGDTSLASDVIPPLRKSDEL